MGDKFEVRRFSEMTATELKSTLSTLNEKFQIRTKNKFDASRTMSNISPPSIKHRLVPKLSTVPSIPHRTKGAPYVE